MKIKRYLSTHEEKTGTRGTPVRSNMTAPDSAKMNTSKGTIQGYNSIAVSDAQNQVILYARTWGSVGEQQTLEPAVETLKQTVETFHGKKRLKDIQLTADSGFHSEQNLSYLSSTGMDCYIADKAFRSRNPLFQDSQTYQQEKARRRQQKNKSKNRQKYFTPQDFVFDRASLTCQCPANKPMWLSSHNALLDGKLPYRFSGYLKHCRPCHLQKHCMRNGVKLQGRQVAFL